MDTRAVSSRANCSSEDEIDYLEIPSFLESLACSASQLKDLAEAISQHYIKGLISYGYIHEPRRDSEELSSPIVGMSVRPKTANDRSRTSNDKADNISKGVLESISCLVDLLPFLNDLMGHIEKCFTTLELTFRRFNYHLNKTSSGYVKQQSSKGLNEFKPPPESRFEPIFVSMMDLLFALISLDETIKSHTNIRQSMGHLKRVCQITISQGGDEGLSEDKLRRLIELVRSIETTLCDENRSIFQQCLDHLQHLDLILDKSRPLQGGMRNISGHLSEFIAFYAKNLTPNQSPANIPNDLRSSLDISIYLLQSNLAPTSFMTTLERKILGLSCLLIMNSWIFKKIDKRLAKAFNQMLTRFKRINIINLAESNIFITLSEMLTKYLPKNIVDSKTLNHLKSQDEQLLTLNLSQYYNETSIEAMSWLVKFKANQRGKSCNEPENLNRSIQEAQILTESGVDLIDEINTTVRSTIAIHLRQSKAITRNNLVLLYRLVALLKSIDLALMQEQTSIIDQQLARDRLVRSSWRKLMSTVRKRYITSKYSDQRLDSSTSLTLFSLCSNLIDRLTSDSGRSLLFMVVSMLSSTCFNEQELADLNVLLSQLRPDIYERLGRCSNCAYLYWNVPTFSAYYNYVFEEDPGNIGEISYFQRAIDDVRSLFKLDARALGATNQPTLDWLEEECDPFIERLADELMLQLKSNTLDKICQELEIELRLQTHRDLHLDGHNPFRRHLYNFKQIFSATHRRQFSLFGRHISLRQYVEQYLSEIYYNLTSISPHDWFTYDCMINLARQKYGLQLANSQMPTQTIDCGLDLMEITRNLALFVSRYSYDMSNQLFVEKCSNRLSTSSAGSVISGQTTNTIPMLHSNNFAANQSLNVIQIRHVSMSIQNHGFGLLNSAINCTYQVMKRLIKLISRQTSDDRLQAVLTKQHQQLSSCLVGSGISFDKALKLVRKFKITHSDSIDVATAAASGAGKEQTGADLDQIRQSLTQLGNSLAFMRLLKSGALNCASKSVDYLPDQDDTSLLRLKKLVQSEFCRHQSAQIGYDPLLEAASNFDACLEDFGENFSPKTDYFSIVLSLFSEALNSDKQQSTSKGSNDAGNIDTPIGSNTDHQPLELDADRKSSKNRADRFKFFYLLVPSLTINFIDHIINAKERVLSRSSASRVGALICDDGFSMGVAFLLIVLRQTAEFAKLEWFKEVRTKLDADQAEVQRKIGNSKYEESLKQTSSMTLRRLNRLRQEYDGLNYNLKSALLLFRSSTMQAKSFNL